CSSPTGRQCKLKKVGGKRRWRILSVENMFEAFFTRLFQSIRRGIAFVNAIVLWPFRWATRWYANRGWILRAMVGALVALTLTVVTAEMEKILQAWGVRRRLGRTD